MSKFLVRTKEDLEFAIKNNEPDIIIVGELAEKVNRSLFVKKLSKPTLIALGVAIAATPVTGGFSGAVGVAAAVALSGVEVIAIVAVVFLGLALIISMVDKYNFEFNAKNDDLGEASMKMKSKKRS